MASTYVNDLRLEEQATGENSGSWGTKLNSSLEQIAEAFSYGSEAIANASTHTITMADGTSDEARSFYLKCTGGGQACTVTLAPNTVSKVWMIENATSYTLTFTQGSGANVAVLAGEVKMLATDGAGSGAVVYDLLTDVNVADSLKISGTTPTLTIGDAGAEDTKIVFDGNAQDYYIGLDDSADDLVIGKGSAVGTTPAIVIDENLKVGINFATPTAKLSLPAQASGDSGIARFAIESAVDSNDFTISQYEDGTGTYTLMGQNISLNSGGNVTVLDSAHKTAGVLFDGRGSGQLSFYTGAANASSEKMRIDSSGNVGIGTTTTTGNSGQTNIFLGGTSNILSEAAATADASLSISQNAYIDSDGSWEYRVTDEATNYYQNAGNHVWRYAASGSAGADISWSEAMRINTNGNVTVGTSDESQVDGAGVKLIKGTNGRVFVVGGSTTSGESFSHFADGGYRFYVSYNGTINSTSTSISGISDERLKENIKDLDQGLADVLKLKPRKYDWKEGEGSGATNVSGFVAQEAETAGFGEFVGDFKHNTLSDAKSFAQGGLIPVLVKSIQELSAKNDSLEARIKTLEDA